MMCMIEKLKTIFVNCYLLVLNDVTDNFSFYFMCDFIFVEHRDVLKSRSKKHIVLADGIKALFEKEQKFQKIPPT